MKTRRGGRVRRAHERWGGRAAGASLSRAAVPILLILLLAAGPAHAQVAAPDAVTPDQETVTLDQAVREAATPLDDSADLDPLLEAAAGRRVVMIGEASHGTSEFYLWRADLTRRLVEEEGFDFVVVEGDWPDLYDLNLYVRGGPGASAAEVLGTFERWPTWMWANWETAAFAEWLRAHNAELAPHDQVGFYGLDVYSLWESLTELLDLPVGDARERAAALEACLEPYGRDERAYARATLDGPGCDTEAEALVEALEAEGGAGADDFHRLQNARVVAGALRYHRAAARGGAESWNVRDRHMMDTVEALSQHLGPDARGVVWAHNTHVGDARYTNMVDQGAVNLGQLARERYGDEEVLLVGFDTYHGTVIAAEAWDAPAEVMPVPPAREDSVAGLFAALGERDWLLPLEPLRDEGPHGRVPQRAIGVVYDPDVEAFGNYVPTVLQLRYDAILFLYETEALHPLGLEPDETAPPAPYPWGFQLPGQQR